jgi:hydrogenase maturation protease
MRDTLVICIGNVARGDDGVGHSVADILTTTAPQDAVVIAAVDLDVAMAVDVAQSDLFIVVDAERRDEPAVLVGSIPSKATGRATGHGMDAPTLLSLAADLYGHAPETAVIVSVAAPMMGHRVGLSSTAEAASLEAASAVLELIGGRISP